MSETTTGWEETTTDRSDSTLDGDESTVDSRWWWGVAAVPIWSLIGLFVMIPATIVASVVSPDLGFMIGFVSLIVWALGAALLDFLFVLAIYFDSRAVEDAGIEWDTEGDTYLLVAAIGLLVPLVHTALSLYYLHQRHTYVGTP